MARARSGQGPSARAVFSLFFLLANEMDVLLPSIQAFQVSRLTHPTWLRAQCPRDEVERMKERRQLPFDKGASEWVPTDMQPANEWSLLKDTFLFDWPLLPQQDFALRLLGVFGVFFFAVSLPIAGITYDQPEELLPRLFASCIGASSVVTALLLRLFLGVKFVSDRLQQDAVYFESDERNPITSTDLERLGYRNRGAMWIKPESIIARDRLIRQFEVSPVIEKLKISSAATLFVLVMSIAGFSSVKPDEGYDPRFIQSENKLQELVNPSNEDIANREAERLRKRGNKPAYCYSRYYKALAVSDQSICGD
ncbi:hypothetical protein GUITHDRAFT_136549 [Guillardia theta CCMP2712]|uniref:Uncharacterized protein n=1 Tax=Guillardia theta (strain CCMP2712) TaxID=905079 RepID=L1JKS6_GUITC|nr:hypothetical protein GUITHDRAFT_136549 [Guillardia theta CCMP2712]EKX48922.1 hypothetical protein GUITHDRAFT_136549 [Guillardia theta CCMP2712]|eukprot:XP_005835902.1 hypothetical protein GUITHDRAFT_136549 [Guillardia theta CCMP2712]